MAINFMLSPYVVHHLGNTAYGVWTVTLSLTGYLGLLDLGVRGAVTRYVARFHTQQDHEHSSNVASSAMMIFATAGLVAILTSIVLAGFVVGHMKIPAQYVGAARIVLVIIGLNIAVSLVNGVFGGILVGLQRFDLTNSIEIGLSVLRAVAIVTALYLGYGIVTLAIVQLAATTLRWAANIGLTRYLYPELRIRLNHANRAGINLIFSFSVFSFLLHVSDSLIYASDELVIATFLRATAVAAVTGVAFYAIGGNLVQYSRTIAAAISQTMTPLASSVEASQDQRKLQNIVLFGARAGSMIMFPIAVTFLLRGSTFIGLWMGSQYADLSGKVLWILAITLLFWAGNGVTAGSLLGLSKHKPLVPAMVVEGVFNLALSIALVRTRLGILGVAWGTVIPSVASNMLFWPWYIHRALGIHPVKYAMSTWVRPGVAILPFALGTYAIEHYWTVTHVMLFFVQVLVCLPLAAAGYWLICLDRTQRDDYSRKFSQSLVKVFARS